MQSLEAALSLMFFIAMLYPLLLSVREERQADDSLYRIQLAGDAWRVLYLRGDFRDFNESRQAAIEADMIKIKEQTGMCVFLSGTQFTSCRDGVNHTLTASLRKTLIWDGRPKAVAFSIGK